MERVKLLLEPVLARSGSSASGIALAVGEAARSLSFDVQLRSLVETVYRDPPQHNPFEIERLLREIDIHLSQASIYKRQYHDIEAQALAFALERASQDEIRRIDQALLDEANPLAELEAQRRAYEASSEAFEAMGDSGSGHAALYRALAKATAIEHGTAARRIALAGEKIELSRQSAATITDTHRKENGPTDFASRLARAWRFFSWEIRQAYIKAISLWLGIAEIFRLEDYAVAPAPDTPSWFDAFTAFFRDLRELYTTRTRNEVEHFVARSVFSVPRAAATAEAEWQTFLERLQGGGRLGVPVSGEAGGRVTGIAIAFVQRAWNEDADLPPEIDEVEDKSAIRAAAEKRAALAQERRQRELLIDVIPPDWLFHIVPREGDPAATHLRPALQGQERLVRPEVPNVPAHPLNVQSLVFFSGHPIHNIPFAGEWQIRLPAEFTGPDVEDPIVWRDDAGVWQTDLEDIIVYFRVRRRTPKREDASIDVF